MVALGVADDEPDILKLFRIIMGRKGYSFSYLANNGQEAVEMHRAAPADVVFLDYNMPYMDGLQASESILGEFPDTKVFLMTCGEDIKYRINGMKEITILKKPFQFKSIIPLLGI